MQVNDHDFAVKVEFMISNIFNCRRYGLGGIADADFIEKRIYIALACTLSSFYKGVTYLRQQAIEEFLDKYHYYCDKGIPEIRLQHGAEAVETIIREFSDLIHELSIK